MSKRGSLGGVAIRILAESLTPLRPETIAVRAIATGALPPGAGALEATVEEALDADVDSNGERSAFVRASPGHYGLNADRPHAPGSAHSDPGMSATRQLMAAAGAILRGSLGPLSPKMIVNRAVSEGMIRPDLNTIVALLEETMDSEIASGGPEPKFAKLPSGHYGLRRHPGYDMHDITHVTHKASRKLPQNPFPQTSYEQGEAPATVTHQSDPDLLFTGSPATAPGKIIGKPTEPMPIPKSDRWPHTEYAGKGGEHLVTGILLLRQCDVSMPTVDKGADLTVATGDFTHNHVQVKTAQIRNDSCRFGIRSSSFRRRAKSNMFYVFVIRQRPDSPGSAAYLVFPHARLAEYVRQEHIQQRSKTISIKFFKKGTRFLLGSKKLDVSSYRNNWDPLTAAARGCP